MWNQAVRADILQRFEATRENESGIGDERVRVQNYTTCGYFNPYTQIALTILE